MAAAVVQRSWAWHLIWAAVQRAVLHAGGCVRIVVGTGRWSTAATGIQRSWARHLIWAAVRRAVLHAGGCVRVVGDAGVDPPAGAVGVVGTDLAPLLVVCADHG